MSPRHGKSKLGRGFGYQKNQEKGYDFDCHNVKWGNQTAQPGRRNQLLQKGGLDLDWSDWYK